MRPCTDEPLRSNPFVRDLNEQEMEVFRRRERYSQKHFLCSGQLLTDPNVFKKLCEHIAKRDDLSHLHTPIVVRNQNRLASYPESVRLIATWRFNGSKTLSRIHPYFASHSAPIIF